VAVPQTEAQLFVLDLDPTHASIRAARRAIEQWAHDVGAGSAAETAKLLVSELATNAVTHARTPFTVRATWHPPYVRIEVVDAAPLPDLDVPRASRLGGWGFEFLDRFSHSWGIEERDTNKAVWFDVHIATHALTPLPDHPTQHSEAQHHSPERIVA
jgi:anti-sigma regulatory factor (Ser/Thr protein kinase)